MRMNQRMRELGDRENIPQAAFPIELRDLLDEGWRNGPARSLLLKGLYGKGWRTDWEYDHVGAREYEVNDVWVPSAGLSKNRADFLSGMTARAFSFAFAALRLAQGLDGGDTLVAVISMSVDSDYLSSGTTIKFFTRRGIYPDYFEDLERFELDAVAVIEPTDLVSGN